MKTILITLLFILSLNIYSQDNKYFTRSGHIWFFSSTPIEDIEAHNNQVNAIIDASNGELVYQVLIKSFEFDKALMQEHFNENYMESDTYPKADFKGKIVNLNEIDFTKDGLKNVIIEGDLTIHGVTKKISEKGTIALKGDILVSKTKFSILLEDYNIKRPKAVVSKIAEKIEINVDVNLDKM